MKSTGCYHIRVSIAMDNQPKETYQLIMWTDKQMGF